MKKYAVIGTPIAHSLSPVLQNAALGEEGVYTAIEVGPNDLQEFLDFARDNLDGLNVTVPLKEAIIPFLDDATALDSKSCNTVKIEDGKLIGFSTDTQGLIFGIQEAFSWYDLSDKTIAFLGCGGAVVAALKTFSQMCKRVILINRTLEKAQALSKMFANVEAVELKTLDSQTLKDVDLLIQSTSLGLKKGDSFPLDIEILPKSILIYDLIYPKTPFLIAAENAGIKVADGRDMLLGQGAKSYEIWTGQDAPIQVMKDALYNAIAKKS